MPSEAQILAEWAERRANFDRRADARKADLHHNGIHVECRPAGRYCNDTWRQCPRAGRVERYHGHDHDGPLVCGCDDWATD